MTWTHTKLLLLICEGMYLERRNMSKPYSLSQHHWYYPISLGFQVLYFLSFLSPFFFFCREWMGESWNQNINSFRSFYFSCSKIGLKSLVEYLSFFPEPQQRREGRLSKAASKDLDKHHLHQGLQTRLVVSYCQTEGQGPGGAAALWALLAARPWEQEIWPVWEEARARSRITLLFFPDSCHPCTSSCFHEISVERFPQSGKSHREILSSSAPSLCWRKWWRLF